MRTDPDDSQPIPFTQQELEPSDGNGVDAAAPMVGEGRVAGGIGPGPLPRWARWPHAVRALRHRDYRLLWIGALVSNVGSWMQNVAQAWLVYDLTQSSTWLGIDAFAGGVPVVLLLPLGGVLADRFNRRTLLVWSNLMTGVLAAILAVMAATGFLTADRVGWIIALSVGTGITDAIRIPANQSLVPLLVGRDDLPNALALNSIQFNISRALGPALAGVSLVTLGVSWSFAFNAVSFGAVIAAIVMMRHVPATAAVRESMLASLRGGVTYLRSRRDLVAMMALVVVGGFLVAPVTGKMLPSVAHEVFHSDSSGYSKLVSSFGVGAVIGAMVLAVRGKGVRPWGAVPLYVLLGVAMIGLSWRGPFAVGMLMTGVCGGAFVASMVQINTAILHSSPDAVRGRVSSFQVMSFRAGMPLGNLAAGLMADRFGVRPVLWAFGAALVVLAPALMLGVRRKSAKPQA